MWQTWKDEQSGRQLQETAGTRGVFTSITLNDEVGNSLGGRPIRRPSRRGRWGRPPRRISEWNRDIFPADRKRNNGVVHRRYRRYRLNSKTEIGRTIWCGRTSDALRALCVLLATGLCSGSTTDPRRSRRWQSSAWNSLECEPQVKRHSKNTAELGANGIADERFIGFCNTEQNLVNYTLAINSDIVRESLEP